MACVFFFHLRRTFGSERLWGADLQAPGLVGVLLFFVHTSLVLMLSLERTAAEEPLARPFYIRRFFRIYPLSIACVLAAVVLYQPLIPWLPYIKVTLMQAAANLLLVQNITGHASSWVRSGACRTRCGCTSLCPWPMCFSFAVSAG